jgi:hypothetical protein
MVRRARCRRWGSTAEESRAARRGLGFTATAHVTSESRASPDTVRVFLGHWPHRERSGTSWGTLKNPRKPAALRQVQGTPKMARSVRNIEGRRVKGVELEKPFFRLQREMAIMPDVGPSAAGSVERRLVTFVPEHEDHAVVLVRGGREDPFDLRAASQSSPSLIFPAVARDERLHAPLKPLPRACRCTGSGVMKPKARPSSAVRSVAKSAAALMCSEVVRRGRSAGSGSLVTAARSITGRARCFDRTGRSR